MVSAPACRDHLRQFTRRQPEVVRTLQIESADLYPSTLQPPLQKKCSLQNHPGDYSVVAFSFAVEWNRMAKTELKQYLVLVSGHSSGLFAVFVDFAFKDVCESNVTYIPEAYTLWISAAVLSAIVRFYGKFHHSSQEKLDPCSMS